MARTRRRARDHQSGDLQLSRARTAATKPSLERTAATKISSHLPVDRPHLAFVNSTAQAALGTLDQVAKVAAVSADA